MMGALVGPQSTQPTASWVSGLLRHESRQKDGSIESQDEIHFKKQRNKRHIKMDIYAIKLPQFICYNLSHYVMNMSLWHVESCHHILFSILRNFKIFPGSRVTMPNSKALVFLFQFIIKLQFLCWWAWIEYHGRPSHLSSGSIDFDVPPKDRWLQLSMHPLFQT